MDNFKTNDYFYKIISIFPQMLRNQLIFANTEIINSLQEIRLRINRPIVLTMPKGNYFVSNNGRVTTDSKKAVITTKQYIEYIFHGMCNYSVYNRQNEIINGYITLEGGHRAGICGTAVFDKDRIININNISSINIRISREHKNCSKAIFDRLGDNLCGLLLCGAPCSGKTTIIRDIAQILSTEYSLNVSLIDSKNEISSTYRGVPMHNIGNCDVLNSYPKDIAIEQAVRNLSPDIIICDEIGTVSEAMAIKQGLNSGVGFIATIHATSLQDLANKECFTLIKDTGAFKKSVFLKSRQNVGQIDRIINIGDIDA